MANINVKNPFAAQDYALIVNTFEQESTNYPSEEYAYASHYKDVYATRNFSERAQEQLSYYPGMHQSSVTSTDNSFYSEAKAQSNEELEFWNSAFDSPESFMNALRDNDNTFDYQSIFGSDVSAEERAKNIGKMITECVPCFGRITDLNQLLPNGNLLEIHGININARFDMLDDIKKLFNDPGSYINICELLNLLSSMCPSDLLGMIVMLTQYLAKINLDIKFNLDFIINLVGPILSPFLNALSQWLDKWMQLIIEPMICVTDHINSTILTAQQVQIPFSGGASILIEGSSQNGAGGIFGADTESQSGFYGYDLGASSSYRNDPPDVPDEEISASVDEMRQAWRPTETIEERQAKFDKLKGQQQNSTKPIFGAQSKQTLNPEEKYDNLKSFGDYNPPEKQAPVKAADAYFDPSPIADSLVQIRNVLQASVQYANDWFKYITQMIYDLLNMDFGWMKRKTGTSYIKSRVVQIIAIIKAILEARNKNGLECGLNSNFDENQMKFILENTLSNYTNTNFKVNDEDGTISIVVPGTEDLSTSDQSIEETDSNVTDDNSDTNIDTTVGSVTIPTSSKIEQKAQESGIIIENCLRGLKKDQINEVKSWISNYEGSLNG